MADLPDSPPQFFSRKTKILEQLQVPDTDYTDASPKGSVDEGIKELIAEINAYDGFVTTSSCAGRVSVFLEGVKEDSGPSTGPDEEQESRAANQVASSGGKGGGGKWLFVSHDPLDRSNGSTDATSSGNHWRDEFALPAVDGAAMESMCSISAGSRRPRLIHFKFEPMILHILTASLAHAQLAIKCGLQGGFRESGALNLVPGSSGQAVTPMVAIRSMGLGFESMIGIEQVDGQRYCTVAPEYIAALVTLANEHFAENQRRIQRFREALKESMQEQVKLNKDGMVWEDAAARRERKRAEGLRRREELRQSQRPATEDPGT